MINSNSVLLLGGGLLLSASSASAALILADTNNGNINTGTTWVGDAAPVAGDMNQWGSSTLTVRSTTQTWEGQELIVQSGGRFASGGPGVTVTMNGELTLDGGTITVLNNNPFTIDLGGNNFNLNSGKLDGGSANSSRDLIFTNGALAGSGTITIEGGESAANLRSDVQFGNGVDTSGFTGVFESSLRARFLLPEISAANASFGLDISGSSGVGLTGNVAVTSAVLGGVNIPVGTWTRDELVNDLGVNPNRVLGAFTGDLTVIPEPSVALLGGLGLLGLLRRRR